MANHEELVAEVKNLAAAPSVYSGLKDLAGAIDGERNLALLAVKQEGSSLRWLVSCTGTYRDFDFNAHRSELLAPVSGKGGGRAPLYQGSASGERETFFRLFRGLFS